MEFIPHLIVDPGYDTTRIGKAGEDFPNFIGPSQIGILQSTSDPLVGTDDLFKYNDGMNLTSFMGQDGFIHDYEAFDKFFEKAHKKVLTESQCTLIIKALINMELLIVDQEDHESLMKKITRPGIKDCAKENHQYIELLKITKLKQMTTMEQIEIIRNRTAFGLPIEDPHYNQSF